MQNKKVLFLMLLVPLLWSPTFLFTSEIMDKIQPMTLICVRFFAAYLATFCYRELKSSDEKIQKQDIKIIILITVTCLSHYILSNFSTIYLNTTESIVFSSFQCITTMVCASFLLGTPVTVKNSVYVGLYSIGAILTMSIANITVNTFFSYIGMFLSIIVWSIYCIFMPKLTAKYNISTILHFQFKWIAILTAPFILIEKNAWGAINFIDACELAYLCIPSTLVAFMINAHALKKIGPLTVGFVMGIGPIMVAMILAIFYKVQFSISQYVGIVMISLGIIMVICDEIKQNNKAVGGEL